MTSEHIYMLKKKKEKKKNTGKGEVEKTGKRRETH